MRILHVINQLWGGGAEASVRDILLGLGDRRLEHGLAVLSSGRNVLDGLHEAGVETFVPDRPLPSRAARIRHVHGVVRAFRPDWLHTTLFEADLAGRVVGLLTRTPVLTSLVNTPYASTAPEGVKARAARTVDRALARHATEAFHAITEAAARAGVADLGVDPARIHVVPRGRDPRRLEHCSPGRRRDARAALGVDESTPVLLNLAREEPQKGQVHLVDALPAIRGHAPGALLVIAGRPGRASPALTDRVEGLALGAAVRRLGFRADVADLLCAADVFVFPSRYEGLGGAVLEAMATRVPVVASDVPAVREVLDGGRCGLLVPVGDPDALARAVVRALGDPAGSRAMADRAYERFRARYTLDACVDGMRRLYLGLGAGPP